MFNHQDLFANLQKALVELGKISPETTEDVQKRIRILRWGFRSGTFDLEVNKLLAAVSLGSNPISLGPRFYMTLSRFIFNLLIADITPQDWADNAKCAIISNKKDLMIGLKTLAVET